jgi:hypothetical protein
MTIRSWVDGRGVSDPDMLGRGAVCSSRQDPPLPYKAGRIACLVLAVLVLTAGMGVLFSGKAQVGSLWLFLLGATCIWISSALRPPHAS